MEGRKIMPPKPPEPTKPSDLMEALRQSAHNDSKARAEKRKTAPRKTTSAASRLILNPAVDAGHGGNLRPGLQP